MACNCNEGNKYNIGMGCCVPTLAPIENYYTKSQVDKLIEDINVSGVTEEELDEKIASAKTEIENEIPTVPSNVSAFVNDVPYLTEHQSLDGYATEEYVNTQISSQTSNFVSGEELSSYTYDKSTIDSKIAQGGSFNPSLYYDKTTTDALLADKLDASAYTPTDLNNYYTKNQVDTALDGKASAKALSDEARSREAVDDILYENVNTKLPTSAFTAYSASTKNVLDNKLDATAYTPTDLSNYYNKTEVDNKVSQSTSGLQQTLSAGTNISISNNVISATDTTYSAGDGIQISGNTISTTTKFQCLTEQEWASVSGNPDTNTVYFIR